MILRLTGQILKLAIDAIYLSRVASLQALKIFPAPGKGVNQTLVTSTRDLFCELLRVYLFGAFG